MGNHSGREQRAIAPFAPDGIVADGGNPSGRPPQSPSQSQGQSERPSSQGSNSGGLLSSGPKLASPFNSSTNLRASSPGAGLGRGVSSAPSNAMETDDRTTSGTVSVNPNKKFNLDISKADLVHGLGKEDESLPASQTGMDFSITEGQARRNMLADCDNECSHITDFLFVSGAKVACNWDLLVKNKISRVCNCALTVVSNYFISNPQMTYLSLSLLDSRQDDIAWFVNEVIQFIERGRLLGQRTLLHCEKGVSRSCSFAIAYIMWSKGINWREAFDFVKLRRAVCAPNTGFSCNLIELSDVFNGKYRYSPILFRCAHHSSHDMSTATLKPCIHADTRKILAPRTSLLDPRGVFVLRVENSSNYSGNNSKDGGGAPMSLLIVWIGANSASNAASEALRLAECMLGIMSHANRVGVVHEGSETQEFLCAIKNDGPFNYKSASSEHVSFDDLYLAEPIVISRSSTPSLKLRSEKIAPVSIVPSPSPSQSQLQSPPVDAKVSSSMADVVATDIGMFVKVRRSSRQGGSPPSLAPDSPSERDRDLVGDPMRGVQQVSAPRMKKRQHSDAMDLDCSADNSNNSYDPLDDSPSPKYQNSEPEPDRSSSFDSVKIPSSATINALNSSIKSCQLDGDGGDPFEASFSSAVSSVTSRTNDLTSSIGPLSTRLPLGLALNIPTPSSSIAHDSVEPSPALSSIVEQASGLRPVDLSSSLSSNGKYEIWNPASSGGEESVTMPSFFKKDSSSSTGGGGHRDPGMKELHPDHVDSPHIVIKRPKPLLYVASYIDESVTPKPPTEPTEFEWMPLGVYDDEDLTENALLLLVCPKPPHFLWVGGEFTMHSTRRNNTGSSAPKQRLSESASRPRHPVDYEDVDSDGGGDSMDICDPFGHNLPINLSGNPSLCLSGSASGKSLLAATLRPPEDLEALISWARRVNASTIDGKTRDKIFAPGSILVQQQDDEIDLWWTSFYTGM